jgi:hypothetical protein
MGFLCWVCLSAAAVGSNRPDYSRLAINFFCDDSFFKIDKTVDALLLFFRRAKQKSRHQLNYKKEIMQQK